MLARWTYSGHADGQAQRLAKHVSIPCCAFDRRNRNPNCRVTGACFRFACSLEESIGGRLSAEWPLFAKSPLTKAVASRPKVCWNRERAQFFWTNFRQTRDQLDEIEVLGPIGGKPLLARDSLGALVTTSTPSLAPRPLGTRKRLRKDPCPSKDGVFESGVELQPLRRFLAVRVYVKAHLGELWFMATANLRPNLITIKSRISTPV